ncbi:MAG: hypothetical protein HY217_06770 [Candidatus Rokubacteria bacterium]|nr:hypothetical protein [Candidatus Rokubacteria bacterium]
MGRWFELLLPLSAMTALFVYFRPDALPPMQTAGDPLTHLVVLALWSALGSLAVVLAIAGLVLLFCLLYSPLYLLRALGRRFGPAKWVDREEMRFYCWSFLLLLVFSGLALVTPRAALPAFLAVTGSAPIFWRRVR